MFIFLLDSRTMHAASDHLQVEERHEVQSQMSKIAMRAATQTKQRERQEKNWKIAAQASIFHVSHFGLNWVHTHSTAGSHREWIYGLWFYWTLVCHTEKHIFFGIREQSQENRAEKFSASLHHSLPAVVLRVNELFFLEVNCLLCNVISFGRIKNRN